MRQIQLTPTAVSKIALRVRNVFSEISCRPIWFPRSWTQNQFIAGRCGPIFDFLVSQTAFRSRRIAFLKSPVSVERDAFTQRNGCTRCGSEDNRIKSSDEEEQKCKARNFIHHRYKVSPS